MTGRAVVTARIGDGERFATSFALPFEGKHLVFHGLSIAHSRLFVNRWQQMTGQQATLEATGETFPG